MSHTEFPVAHEMKEFPIFPGFDGLMTLSRREGVDIRPTLLRVLTDLYFQTPSHTADEERQYVELASRLIDEVDDATLAAVRARLSIYPRTPQAIADKLVLRPPGRPSIPAAPGIQPQPAPSPPTDELPEIHGLHPAAALSMQPNEASELNSMFFAADAKERVLILRNLENTPLKAAARPDAHRAARAIAALESMALEADQIGFIRELAHILILPTRMAQQIVEDPGGEALACAAKTIGMPSESFERVLLFLDPELGASVTRVYTLSRLYDTLSERVALIMLAAWRSATLATTRARHQPLLHDDERQRARAAPAQSKAGRQPSAAPLSGTPGRNNANG
jgi:hypothetical protein